MYFSRNITQKVIKTFWKIKNFFQKIRIIDESIKDYN